MSTDIGSKPEESEDGGRIEVIEDMLDIAHEEIVNLEERLNEVEASYESQIEVQQDRIRQLEQRVNELDDRTDLLQIVETADETDGEQRSAALLLHLKRQAEREGERGRGSTASVDHSEAMNALHYPDVHRTTIYHDWERCVRWVGDETVCWKEERNGTERLFLDLENVDENTIPHTIHQKGEKP